MPPAIVTSPPHAASPTAPDSQTDAAEPVPPYRHIIIHYHLFKNAGTSLDQTLKQNFGAGWCEHEGGGAGWRAQGVRTYLLNHPGIVVLSSHTALLPPPILPDTSVYPVIFLRHPIDRIRSIYEFEVKQIADTDGARMAKQTDLAGYIRWRLESKGDRAIRNFQAYRLSFAVPERNKETQRTEEERALEALETLPFIGIVEAFDNSIATLQEWLKPIFPHIEFKPTKANVTQRGHLSLEERLQGLHDEIGTELYTNIQDANVLDMKLWELAIQR